MLLLSERGAAGGGAALDAETQRRRCCAGGARGRWNVGLVRVPRGSDRARDGNRLFVEGVSRPALQKARPVLLVESGAVRATTGTSPRASLQCASGACECEYRAQSHPSPRGQTYKPSAFTLTRPGAGADAVETGISMIGIGVDCTLMRTNDKLQCTLAARAPCRVPQSDGQDTAPGQDMGTEATETGLPARCSSLSAIADARGAAPSRVW